MGDPIWTTPLKEQLCIVDIDTRPMNESNEAWAEDGTFDWARLASNGPSPGILNHYLYAQIHGYCYRFIHTHPYPDRAAVWTRIPALASLLKSHKILVSVDADVIFPNLHLPYEWLLNHWNITDNISIAMALEPQMDWWANTKDSKNHQNVNAGFMTLQNTPLTHEMLHRWTDCPEPSPTGYEGCARLKLPWPAEQGAFCEFVRYDFPDNVREFPCTEGLGWPNMESDCKGTLVSHYTLAKDITKGAIESALAQGVMQRLQGDMMRRKDEIFVERMINEIDDDDDNINGEDKRL